ncbi:ergothioneine biosynthesis glutamate--cysteine ligase EgtA [Mycobacterium sp. pV006]|uniref:ergothioneine biosynthesis glutamate--cysteine ligase EgtA n=1 Tax=Mycobacterium sp. pV006 TaxID=3238983 RepID=UPI00351AECB2
MARTTTRAGIASDCLNSADAAIAHIVDGCLTDGPVGRVGLELEAHCYDIAEPARRPDWTTLTAVIAGLPSLPGGSIVTVEPGGAVELSGPPLADAVSAIAAMAADRAVLRACFAAAGLGLVLLGADPLRPAGRVNPGARYRAMEAFFRASGTEAAGAAMMTATASLQINLEAGPRAQWAQRVRLTHALGPTLVAIAANSPVLHGEVTGWQSSRQRVWSRLDAARCGPILGAGDDPADDWAHYALRAPLMLVHTPEPEPLRDWVSFADWADGRVLLADRRPTVADLDYHLTTLFPPVRPRGFLEIRYLDSVPDALWPALAFTVTALLDDPVAAQVAAEATEPVATAWDLAAQAGLADPGLHRAARLCVDAAAQRAPAALQESMELLTRSVHQGRCPADDFTDQAATHGVAAAVGRLARGEL